MDSLVFQMPLTILNLYANMNITTSEKRQASSLKRCICITVAMCSTNSCKYFLQ